MSTLPPETSLPIGEVLRLTFEGLGRHWVFVLGVSLPFTLAYTAVDYDAGIYRVLGDAGGGLLMTTFNLFLAFVCTAFVAVRLCDDLTGSSGTPRNSVSEAFRRLGPVLWVSLLGSLGITIGFVFLAIPGIFLNLMWWVLIPPMVVEDVPSGEAFGRSAYLTEGNRWRLFGLWLIFLVIGLVVALPSFFFIDFDTGDTSTAYWPISLITNLILMAITAISSCITFVLLRRIKEGDDTSNIASVFD